MTGTGVGISGEETGKCLQQRGGAAPLGTPCGPEGSCCQRSRPVLGECSGTGDFSLSLALARREQLRKVALAISQKSSAHPETEGSGLSSPSSGSADADLSRDAAGRVGGGCAPSLAAEAAREGAGAATWPSTRLGWAGLS